MLIMGSEISENDITLKILPMESKGEMGVVKLSELKSGIKPTVEINNSIVAFVDILGFSNKINVKDIENTLLDFSGSLTTTANEFPNIRFNVFSDNVFLATKQDNAKELLSALRYVFGRWVWNGILVRGGISLGTYREFSSAAIQDTSDNFIGNLFSGTAIVKAVKLEGSKDGAFLFTDNETATFFKTKFSEPIFGFKKSQFLGWSDDNYRIFLYTAISLYKLLRIVESKDNTFDEVKQKFLNNLAYAKMQSKNKALFTVTMLTILSDITFKQKTRKKMLEIMKIKQESFEEYKKYIKKFREKNAKELEAIKGIVSWDSSLPNWKK